MECSVCFDIAHPECVGVDSHSLAVSEDVPNSWECPECCESGRNRQRQGKARARKVSVSSAASSAPTTDSEQTTTPSKRPDPTEVSITSPIFYTTAKFL